MTEPMPGLNHGAVLDGYYLRLRERNHEGLGEAEGLYTKGHALWRDLQRAEARVKELEKWRDAVLRIVDSLDDPPSGLTWDGEPQETCTAELGYLRSVLVPLVRGEGGEDE